METPCWSVTDDVDGVHVVPEDDLIVHRKSVHCFCDPTVGRHAVHHQPHLWVRLLVTHRAMDGRE